MNALVIYDSRYGNTERIAEAVALAVQEALPTRLAAVDEIDDCEAALRDVDLLVIGGPTHRHGIDGIRVAAFDTRARGSRVLTGSAAVRIGRLVRRHGAWLVVPPASFIVESTTGPLQRGELDHAREWARDVLRAVGIRPRERGTVSVPD
jgi:hypothetical protein